MTQKIRGQFTKGTKVNREAVPVMPVRKTVGRAMGLITLDMFHTSIPVFLTDADRVTDMRARGLPAEPCVVGHYGLACFSSNDDGMTCYCMVITSAAQENTISHECSHITDFIFEDYGIPPGIESTELRAYMTSYLITETTKIVAENQKRYPALYGLSQEAQG